MFDAGPHGEIFINNYMNIAVYISLHHVRTTQINELCSQNFIGTNHLLRWDVSQKTDSYNSSPVPCLVMLAIMAHHTIYHLYLLPDRCHWLVFLAIC